MSQKSSLKSTFLGFGSSLLSIAGLCGGGACVATCGVVCLAPLASFLGISTAGLTVWLDELLPLFIAISAVAFTISYYSLYKQPEGNCCEETPNQTKAGILSLDWRKRLFWIGLMFTIGMYGYTFTGNTFPQTESLAAEPSSCSSLAVDTSKESCQPSSCSTTK